MKNIDFEKLLRYLMIFAILVFLTLLSIVNFFPDFAYDFYDLNPGSEHGQNNFITYPSAFYLFSIYICFRYLGSNDLKYIDTLIIFCILIAFMRTVGIITSGLYITPFTILAFIPEYIGGPILIYLKKMVERQSN